MEGRFLGNIYFIGYLKHMVSPVIYYFGQEQRGTTMLVGTLQENENDFFSFLQHKVE